MGDLQHARCSGGLGKAERPMSVLLRSSSVIQRGRFARRHARHWGPLVSILDPTSVQWRVASKTKTAMCGRRHFGVWLDLEVYQGHMPVKLHNALEMSFLRF